MNPTSRSVVPSAYHRDSSDFQHFSFQWLDYVLSQEYLPQTISTSYGDDEQTGSLLRQ